MKQTNKLLRLIFLAISLAPAFAIAFEGVGSHGGDAVVTPNAIRLRDLMDPGNCTWRAGSTVLQMQPQLKTILMSLKDANPALGYALEGQIQRIRWCFTTTLKQVDTNDGDLEDQLTYYVDPYATNKTQVGVRVLDAVFIDAKVLASMITSDQPYFFIHEATHGFIKPDAKMRNKKVRDVVSGIHSYVAQETNIDDLDACLLESEVQIFKSKDPIQNAFRILNNPKLPLTDIRLLSDKFPSQPSYPQSFGDQIVKDTIRIKQFDTDVLPNLVEVTGFAKFKFMRALTIADVISVYPLTAYDKITFNNCELQTNSNGQDWRNKIDYTLTNVKSSRQFQETATKMETWYVSGMKDTLANIFSEIFTTDQCDQ